MRHDIFMASIYLYFLFVLLTTEVAALNFKASCPNSISKPAETSLLARHSLAGSPVQLYYTTCFHTVPLFTAVNVVNFN